MNILLELFFIFIFLYAIIIFKFPDLDSDLLTSTAIATDTSDTGDTGDTGNIGADTSTEKTYKNDNYLWQKFALFVALFCFYFVIQIIGKIRNKCTINMGEIIGNCYVVAVSGILGYTVFIDLEYMSWSSEAMKNFITSLDGNRYMFTLIVALSIVMFITMIKMVGLLISISSSDQNTCSD